MKCGTKLRRKVKEITDKIDDTVREYAGYALRITSSIKLLLDSPLTDLVVQIIPSDLPKNLQQKASDALAKAVDVLALTSDIANTPDLEEKLKLFMAGLADKSPEFKESQLKKTMDLVIKYMDGERLKDHEYEAAGMGTFITITK